MARKFLPFVLLILLLAACSGGASTRPAPTAVVPTNIPSALEPVDLGTPLASPTTIVYPSTTPWSTAAPAAAAVVPSSPTPAPAALGSANLRGGPGTSYPVVDGVPAGQVLVIVGCNADRTWYELQGGRWIFGELVANAPAVVQVEARIPALPSATWTAIVVAVATYTPEPIQVVLPTSTQPPAAVAPQPAPPQRVCCKICSAGKACGDSCISRSYTCHKGAGCACDA